MTEEEYFRKNYPDSCYGDKPLSPHWDFFQDGVEFGERQSEKKIEELEEIINKLREQLALRYDLEDKIKELEEQNKWYSEQVCNKECAEVWGNLTKAKEIIKKIEKIFYSGENAIKRLSEISDILAEAEQFLNSEVENDSKSSL